MINRKFVKTILFLSIFLAALFWSADNLLAWHVGNHNPGPVRTTGNINYCFTFGASNGQGERGPWSRCTTDATFWHWPAMAEGDWGLNVPSFQPGWRVVSSSGGCSNRNGQTCHMWVQVEQIPQAPVPDANMWADSNNLPYGGSTTVHWTVNPSGNSEISCSGGVSGNSGYSFNTGPLYTNTSYIVTCSSSSGSDQARTDISVAAAPQVETRIRADGSDFDITVDHGKVVNIDWGSNNANASSCRSTGDYPPWTGQSIPPSGASNTLPLSGPVTYTFGMTCDGTYGGTSSDSIRVTVRPPPNRQPIGNHDTNDCTVIGGWAYDPDTPNSEIRVHITDGPVGGGGVYIADVSTSVPRGDVNATYGITGNHGFHINTPNSIKDGRAHTIYVYAIDSGGGFNPIISSSPRTLTCNPVGNISIRSRDTSGSPVIMDWNLLRTGGPIFANQRGSSHDYTGMAVGEWDLHILQPTTNNFIYPPAISPSGKQNLTTGGTITWTATWTPNTPPEANITCNDSSSATVPYGGSVNVEWDSEDASSCSVAPTGWTGTSGDRTVTNLTPPDKTYTLTCTR